jgi:hypothetical protein
VCLTVLIYLIAITCQIAITHLIVIAVLIALGRKDRYNAERSTYDYPLSPPAKQMLSYKGETHAYLCEMFCNVTWICICTDNGYAFPNCSHMDTYTYGNPISNRWIYATMEVEKEF